MFVHVHGVCVKCGISHEVLKSLCCDWILTFIHMVDFTNEYATLHMQKFLGTKPAALQMESVQKKLNEYVRPEGIHDCVCL